MKQITALIAMMALSFGAMANPLPGGGHGGGAPRVVVVRPHVSYVRPMMSPYFGFGYGGWYSPFYNPYGYPYGYGYNRQSSKLQLTIQQIKNDYRKEIADVRHDKTMSRDERRTQIRSIKHDRDNAILEAEKGNYRSTHKAENDDTILP